MMEDIEKLKKIAKLSQELKKHGFASLSDEAVRQSEEIYKEKLPQYEKPKTEGGQMDEQYKDKTSAKIAEMESMLNTVVAKMNEMIKSINDLEQQMKSRPVQAAPRPEAQQKFAEHPISGDSSRPIEAKPEKGSETNQRAGNYTPQDVQIDRIFYSGSGAKKKI